MKNLYSIEQDGSIHVIAGRKAWGVDIPAYAYDIWMPLIGYAPIFVYGLLWRLARDGKTSGMGRKKIASASRMGVDTFDAAVTLLDECGWIKLTVGDNFKSNSYEILDPPTSVSPELINKYQPPSGYKPLTPWLVEEPEEDEDLDLTGSTPDLTESSNIDPFVDPSSSSAELQSPPAQKSNAGQKRTSRRWQDGQKILAAGHEPGDQSKKTADKEEAAPSVADEPLLQAAMDAFNVTAIKVDAKLAKKLNEGHRVEGTSYSGVFSLYRNNQAFKAFADERLKLLSSLGKLSAEQALSNLCNFSSQPDSDSPKRLKGFHYWMQDKVPAVAVKAAPAAPKVVFVDMPEGS